MNDEVRALASAVRELNLTGRLTPETDEALADLAAVPEPAEESDDAEPAGSEDPQSKEPAKGPAAKRGGK